MYVVYTQFTGQDAVSCVYTSVVDPKLLLIFFLFSDPDPTLTLISDPGSSPDPACL
jgi:hypothetical protein